MLDPLSFAIPLAPPLSTSPPRPVRRLLKPTSTPGDYLLEISYSNLSDFIVCPRRGENSLVHNRVLNATSYAFSFGQAFHKCEELRLRHGWSDDTRDKQISFIASHFLQNPVPPDEYRNGDRLVQVLAQYNRRYAQQDSPLFDNWPAKILHHEGEPLIERPFKLSLASVPVHAAVPYQPSLLVYGDEEELDKDIFLNINNIHIILTGTVDCVLSDNDRMWIVDHKTTSRGGSEFVSWYRLSLQTRLYAYAIRQLLGLPIQGLILNGLVIRPPTKTGIGLDFERHAFFYSEDQLEDARRSFISACEDLLHCLVRGFFPQTSLSFRSPCAGCAYHDNCCLPSHQRLADLASGIFRDNEIHGEYDAPAPE